jgi:hypothetical protein
MSRCSARSSAPNASYAESRACGVSAASSAMIADQASDTRSKSRAVRNDVSRLSMATFVAASSSCGIRSDSSKSALPRYGCSDSTMRASSALLMCSTGGAGPRRGSGGFMSAGTAVSP